MRRSCVVLSVNARTNPCRLDAASRVAFEGGRAHTIAARREDERAVLDRPSSAPTACAKVPPRRNVALCCYCTGSPVGAGTSCRPLLARAGRGALKRKR